MRSILMALALVLTMALTASAAPLSLNEIMHATCRVSVSGAMGSGTAVHQDEQNVYILTNAHVVGGNGSGSVEFFPDGRKTAKIPATVIFKAHQTRTDVDFAVMQVSKRALGEFQPRIIPFAPVTYRVKRGEYIASAGHPAGRWAQAWEGYTLTDASSRLLFTPPPLGGQSGSGIFVVINDHTYLAAVLTWRIGNGGMNAQGFDLTQGGAIPISTLHKIISGAASFQPEPIPDNYEEVAVRTRLDKEAWALGEDGKLYPISYYSDGSYDVSLPAEKSGMGIAQWHITDPSGCTPGGNCPPGNPGPGFRGNGGGGGIFGFRPPSIDNNPSPFEGRGGNNQLPPNFGGSNPGSGSSGAIGQLQDENDALRQKIDDLQGQLNDLATERQDLQNQLDSAKGNLSAIKAELDKAQADGSTSEEKIQNLNNLVIQYNQQIENLSQTLNNKDIKLVERHNLIVQLQESLEKKGEIVEENEQLRQQNDIIINNNSSLQTQRDAGFTLFGSTLLGGVLLYVGRLLYLRRVRPRIVEGADRILDRLDSQDDKEDIGKLVREYMEKVEKALASKIPALDSIAEQIDGVQDRIQSSVETKFAAQLEAKLLSLRELLLRVIDDKLQVNSEQVDDVVRRVEAVVANLNTQIDCRLSNIDTKIETTIDARVNNGVSERILGKMDDLVSRLNALEYGKNESQPPVNPTPTPTPTPTPQPTPTPKPQPQPETEPDLDSVDDRPVLPLPEDMPSGFIKEFVDQMKSDGQNVEQWATYGQLYREAVGMLRRGALYYKGSNRLQGQKVTADKLDEWVENEYVKRMTIERMDWPGLYHQVMIGFLYREAVEKLRTGGFSLLGAKETANAIDVWVRHELLKRMGKKIG